jgi:hypothetical protein
MDDNKELILYLKKNILDSLIELKTSIEKINEINNNNFEIINEVKEEIKNNDKNKEFMRQLIPYYTLYFIND